MSSERDATQQDEDFRKLTDQKRLRKVEVHDKNRMEISDVLVSRYSSKALDITVKTLEDIGFNCEAQSLKQQKEKLGEKDPACSTEVIVYLNILYLNWTNITGLNLD